MKKRIRKMVMAVMLMTVVISSNLKLKVAAAENAMLYVTGYEVTNETITPGSDFVLTVKLQNFSTTTAAENIIVTVVNPDDVIPEYGTVSMAYIESIKPEGVEEVTFKYSANADLEKTELNFTVGVITSTSATSSQLRIPVGRITDFTVDEYSVPQKMTVGKVGYASAQVENVGNKGVSNVVMVARCDGVDIGTANIGTIAARTFKTQYVSMTFFTAGRQAVDLVLTYTNADGENKEYLISSSIINVVEEEQISIDTGMQQNSEEDSAGADQNQGYGNIVVMSISGVLLIGVCCVILLLLYRRK